MIIIDSDNYGEHGIETMFFPGGEPHVKVPRFADEILFFAKLRTWNDVAFAALLLNALCEHQQLNVIAFIPYFPAARQDRSDGLAALSVDIMLRLLTENDCVTAVFDPHSHVLRDDSRIGGYFMPVDLRLPIRSDVVGIIAPDAGAIERAEQFRDTFYPNADLIECVKSRDPETGRLSNYQMSSLTRIGGYVIVDDICDGGGTFNLLAEAFDREELSNYCGLEMFVSHGIFSKGLPAISSRIERITTTDSWCSRGLSDAYPARLTVIPLLAQLKDKLAEILDEYI